MKSNAITRIVIFSLVILLLVALLAAGLALHFSHRIFDFGWESMRGGNVVSSGDVDPAQVRNLEIEWAVGCVTIKAADVDTIVFGENEGLDEQQKMVWRQSGDTLRIQSSQRRSIFGFFFGFQSHPAKNLVITVPKDWVCDELNLDAASARVEVTGVTVWDLDFDGASGTCVLTDCDVDTMSIDTASGNISFSGRLRQLTIDAASADFTGVFTNTPDSLDMDTASGEMQITLPADCGFRVNMDGLSMNFSSDFDTQLSDGCHVYGDGRCRINIDGMSSRLTIRKASPAACAHTWDKGTLHTVPGSGAQEMVYVCTLCGQTRSESLLIHSGQHAVRCADADTQNLLLTPLMPYYYENTPVTVQTNILCDADLELYVNGEFVCKQTAIETNGTYTHWEFYFTMPAQDAVIQLKVRGGCEPSPST